MKGKISSYLDTLGSGFDAKSVDGPQLGKAHEEEVAAKDNWTSDKRDAIGRAAFIQKRKRIARKLRRLAREIEALEKAEMNADYKSSIEEAAGEEDIIEVIDDEAKGKGAEDMELADDEDVEEQPENLEEVPEDLSETSDDTEDTDEVEDDDEDEEETSDEESYTKVEASHPIEHNPKKDDPKADGSSQTGDEDWVTVGPGTFKDKRDTTGRAAD